MQKILKWLLSIFFAILISLIAIPFLFKTKLTQVAKTLINQQINAKVDFEDISLTLISSFPNFKFSLSELSVINTGEFQGDTLLKAKKIAFTLDLMSVIKGQQYQVNAVTFDEPHVVARVLKNGHKNWDILKPSTAKPEEPQAPTQFKMTLQKLEIIDADVLYEDALMGIKTKIEGLDHQLSGDFTQDNFVLETLTDIQKLSLNYGGITYLNQVNTHLKADFDADMSHFKFSFKNNELALNDLILQFNGSIAMPDTNIAVDIQFKALKTDFKNILSLVPAIYSTQFDAITTSGKIAINASAKGIYNKKQLPAFNVALRVENGTFKYPSLPKSAKNIQVNLLIHNKTGKPDATQIDLHQFHVELADNPIDAVVHLSTPVSDPNIDAKVLAKLNLLSIADVLPLKENEKLSGNIDADIQLKGHLSSIEKKQYDAFYAKGFVRVANISYQSAAIKQACRINNMTLNFSPQVVNLENFNAKIGRSDLQIKGRIDNLLQYVLKGQLLKGNFDIQSNLIDANEWLGASPQSVATDTASSHLTAVAVPDNLAVTLHVKIAQLLYDKFDITQINGSLAVAESQATLNQLKMNLLGGELILGGFYNTLNIKRPRVNFNISLSNFDIPITFKNFTTVQKLVPIAQYTKGKFGIQLSFNTTLNDKMEPDLTAISGEGQLSTKSIIVEGFEPTNKLAELTKITKFKKLAPQDVQLRFRIKEGRVYVDETPVKFGNVVAKVKGSNGLDQTIDYVWNIEVPRSELGNAANAVADNLTTKINQKVGTNLKLTEKIKIKALITGTITKPIVKTDLATTGNEVKQELKAQAEKIITDKAQELANNAKEKARAEADQLLRDAQVQADRIKAEAQTLANQVKSEGYIAADRLVSQASNPFAKKAAEIAANKAKQEVDNKVSKILADADQRSQSILQNARVEADNKLK